MDHPGVEYWLSLLAFSGAFLLCTLLLLVFRPIGARIDLVDRPTERKVHQGNIPTVGGISIFLATLATQLVLAQPSASLFVAGGLLLVVGILDDLLDLSARSRLLFQAVAAGILVLVGGYQIHSVGSLFTDNAVILGDVSGIVFSIICIIGVINAINMIDGADGLAGGTVSISITALVMLAATRGADQYLLNGLLASLGATIAFLVFNTCLLGARRKVFLGDSGSMFLGIFLAAHFIDMSQGGNAYLPPVIAGWIFGLALMDSVSVMVGRVIRGQSPLKAGRDHLHHQLLDNGFSNSTCVLVMLLFHGTLALLGLLGIHFDIPMPVMFWAFVALTIVHHFLTPRLITQFSVGLGQTLKTSSE